MTNLLNVDDLSLDEQIGQMLFLGWGGPNCTVQINAQAEKCVRDLHAGGMILMGRNVQKQTQPLPPIDASAVREMNTSLQNMAPVPLLIATDQEGGRVARFGSSPFTRMPSARQIAQAGDPHGVAKEAARVTARELAAVGLNMNFAPVADVNSNPQNPVIGDRSFGTTPQTVTPLVLAQMAGYENGGVLPCPKHLPGHGDTALDSHHDLPVLPFSLEEMEARELVPFRAAVAARVPALMTAHIVFPALDADYPATLSRSILTGLLREQMGFNGLIITDCLEMRAVSDKWGTPRAAVLAAVAGADMLLICHTQAKQEEAFAALQTAVQTGELSRARVREAASRVLAAKQMVQAFGDAPPLSVIGSDPHRAVLRAFGGEAENAAPTTLGAEAPLQKK